MPDEDRGVPDPIRVGARFVHAHQLDSSWTPEPGRRYADAPKREMVVTARRGDRVYYKAVDRSGSWAATTAQMQEGGPVVGRWLDSQ